MFLFIHSYRVLLISDLFSYRVLLISDLNESTAFPRSPRIINVPVKMWCNFLFLFSAEHLKHVKLPTDPIWLVGSLGLDLHKLSAWRTVFHGGLFVEPHMPELAEFKTYFIDALQVILNSTHTLWFKVIKSTKTKFTLKI